ncbi:uncharacterized protein LOC119161138 [Rhipicephalus microplus]|uniref:uncharacterized protein LOC119161138 n=1 Tax=Rhipicephalus microplus TaxID=6941 RepID=UPI003F6C341F
MIKLLLAALVLLIATGMAPAAPQHPTGSIALDAIQHMNLFATTPLKTGVWKQGEPFFPFSPFNPAVGFLLGGKKGVLFTKASDGTIQSQKDFTFSSGNSKLPFPGGLFQ